MRILRIANVSEATAAGNITVYTAAGERVFAGKAVKENAEKGNYMLVIAKTFTQRAKRDEEGEIIMGADNVTPEVEECEPWTRTEATFIGSKEDCIEFSKEDELLALEADAYVEQKKEEIKAKKAVKPQVVAPEAAAGVVN